MSSAPPAVAKDATILGWSSAAGDSIIVLREGSNGWTCFADWPVSPGPDPACNDPVWTAWNDAFGKGEEPEVNAVGIAYMLQGGSDASHTDPMASRPAPGEDWVSTPAHIMILADHMLTADDQALATKIDTVMSKLNQAGMFNGAVLIARNGQVVLRKGYGVADHEQNIPNTAGGR